MKLFSYFYFAVFTSVFVCGCENYGAHQPVNEKLVVKTETTIQTRFKVPDGYTRKTNDAASFGYYLQQLPLKPYGTEVKYYDGSIKKNREVYVSVVDLPIGKKNLHECADAVMRLRAEWLYKQKRYNDIHFNFLSDGKPRYFKDYAKGDYSYKKFWAYLENVFAFANTASLHDELQKVEDIKEIQPGDMLIEKKNPYGHVVMVVDMAVNDKGEKIVLLAQSYMPAQEIQILVNPNDPELSPWYHLKEGEIITPEWYFTSENHRRFK
ncbi:MAG: DUF4846 domain-containing protein [Bacteroidota bacterium]